MTSAHKDAVPVFEIDQTDEFSEFLLHREVDILFNLNIMVKQGAILTLYLGDGQYFVLTRLLEIDLASKTVYLDSSDTTAYARIASSSQKITLSGSTIDRIKLQARLQNVRSLYRNGQPVLAADLPKTMLRLQRRAFFRMETPRASPLRCTLPLSNTESIKLPLHDISGGGLCLFGKVGHLHLFPLGLLFHNALLEIPGEGVLSVNLRICEVVMTETEIGEPQLRVGCEFISLPPSRQQTIERYITRLERERKNEL